MGSSAEAMRTKRRETLSDLGRGRDDFDRDYTAILYSHAFRRLRHKTQVFFYSQNDHVCTRLDHSLYVSSIAEIVCKNLKRRGVQCDPVLARTIGIGHDLGHPPFGHAGEAVINELAKELGGFKHEKHGLRIVDKIEKPRDHLPVVGLNLTLAVRDGIVNHCGEDPSTAIAPVGSPKLEGDSHPFTIEGCIVRLVDKVAYLGRDLEDAITAGLIREEDIPGEIAARIGTKNGEIVDYFVGDIIENSSETKIAISAEASALMQKLVKFNRETIYQHDKIEQFKQRVGDVLRTLFSRFMHTVGEYGDRIDRYQHNELRVVQILGKYIRDRRALYFDEERNCYEDEEAFYKRMVIDFMATLTDSFIFQACSEYFLPKPIV